MGDASRIYKSGAYRIGYNSGKRTTTRRAQASKEIKSDALCLQASKEFLQVPKSQENRCAPRLGRVPGASQIQHVSSVSSAFTVSGASPHLARLRRGPTRDQTPAKGGIHGNTQEHTGKHTTRRRVTPHLTPHLQFSHPPQNRMSIPRFCSVPRVIRSHCNR